MNISMGVDATATVVPLDSAGRIAQDVPCLHCGYNLRSLLPDQACPECGAAVEPSLRGDALRFSNPRWLSRLSAGMICIVVGEIAFVADVCGALGWLRFWLSDVLGIHRPGPGAIVALLILGLPVTGLWLATSPEPGRATPTRDTTIRIAARILVLAALLLMLAGLLSPTGTRARMATLADMRWLQLRQMLWCVLGTAGWVAFYIHLRRLGRRAGAIPLAWFVGAAVIALALAGLVSSGICTWQAVHAQEWLAPSLSRTLRSLMAANLFAIVLQQALILLMALLYLRLLRREARRATWRKATADSRGRTAATSS